LTKAKPFVMPPEPVGQHDWARAVLYRTNRADIENKVVFLSDNSRLSLGDPFCVTCGSAYPPGGPCLPAKEEPEVEDPMNALRAMAEKLSFEPIQPKARPSARITRLGGD
jgi:hypothetical protein